MELQRVGHNRADFSIYYVPRHRIESESGSVVFDCLRPHVAHQAPLPMEFSRQRYWSGYLPLLQGIFPTQQSNHGLLHCRRILYQLSYQGSPWGWGAHSDFSITRWHPWGSEHSCMLSHNWRFATPWTVCSLPGSLVHGIFQTRILEWVAISFSRWSSQPRDWTRVSCIAGRGFILWAIRECPVSGNFYVPQYLISWEILGNCL